ncbi:MAG: pyridoxamine 5'-phosphate oxidase family protein [Porticoccaceae bacterium]|nr:pyridoxamine 5'-phosphate oxidase family protein [Porticoccaceae bacterium]
MSKVTTEVADFTKLHKFLHSESVLTLATSDACGPWSAPVLYVADTTAEPFALYFLSSDNSRHIKSIPANGRSAVSIYSDYTGDWQSIRGAQIYSTISKVADKNTVADLYFARFPEVRALIDNPSTEQERLIGSAFAKSNFYRVTPSFVHFTNNGDNFAGSTEWQL